MRKKIKSKALKDFEEELPKIYKKKITISEAKVAPFSVSVSRPVYKRITRTRSKLGTTPPVKSVSSKKVSKWGSSTSTTLPYNYPVYPWLASPDASLGGTEESWWKRIINRLFFWLR